MKPNLLFQANSDRHSVEPASFPFNIAGCCRVFQYKSVYKAESSIGCIHWSSQIDRGGYGGLIAGFTITHRAG